MSSSVRPMVWQTIGVTLLALSVTGCAGRPVRGDPVGSVAAPPAASSAVGVPAPAPAPAPALDPATPRPMSSVAVPVALDPQQRPDAYAPTITPAAFDIAAYRRDSAPYCAEAIPGRCWQVAQPSPTTPLLAVVGATAFNCPVGQSVILRARTEPGMPVTITSFGLGVFPANGQTTITVPADTEGVVSAEFGITSGTAGNVNLTAGSPVRAGTLQFLVHVIEGKPLP